MTTIDAPDHEGASPLQYAAGGPWDGMNRGVAALLVAHGADPKQYLGKNITLVDLSAMAGNSAMVEYWIEEIAYTGLFPEEEEKSSSRVPCSWQSAKNTRTSSLHFKVITREYACVTTIPKSPRA